MQAPHVVHDTSANAKFGNNFNLKILLANPEIMPSIMKFNPAKNPTFTEHLTFGTTVLVLNLF